MSKIIYFGSGKIGELSLKKLIDDNHQDVLSVVTSSDRKKGRHLKVAFSPIKQIALNYNIPVFQPVNLNSDDFRKSIEDLNCDIFVVFAFGKILPKSLLTLPRLMPLNIHASLLPKYRGAAPIQRALINGEKTTGISFIKMNEKTDEGDIVFEKEIKINKNDNASTLEHKISELAADSLISVINGVANKKLKLQKQDNAQATYAQKLVKEDGRINWSQSAGQIVDLIRGCFGWPGTFTHHNGALVKIWDAEMLVFDVQNKKPGQVLRVDPSGILVATQKDALLIRELQPVSGKRLNVNSFIQGHAVKIGDNFS